MSFRKHLAILLIVLGCFVLAPAAEAQQQLASFNSDNLSFLVTEANSEFRLAVAPKWAANNTELSANVFALQNPSRLVIDIPNFPTKAGKTLTLSHPNLKTIRLGVHPSKTRIVVDIRDDAKATHSISFDKLAGKVLVDFSLPSGVAKTAIVEDSPVYEKSVYEKPVYEKTVTEKTMVSSETATATLSRPVESIENALNTSKELGDRDLEDQETAALLASIKERLDALSKESDEIENKENKPTVNTTAETTPETEEVNTVDINNIENIQDIIDAEKTISADELEARARLDDKPGLSQISPRPKTPAKATADFGTGIVVNDNGVITNVGKNAETPEKTINIDRLARVKAISYTISRRGKLSSLLIEVDGLKDYSLYQSGEQKYQLTLNNAMLADQSLAAPVTPSPRVIGYKSVVPVQLEQSIVLEIEVEENVKLVPRLTRGKLWVRGTIS